MFNIICRFFFKLFGWKVQGAIPAGLSKCVFIVCPHNTWKDFFIGLGTRATLWVPISYLGKKELFDNKLFGWFFYKTGGTPVDRFSKNGMVNDVAEIFATRKTFYLAMAPEGTRGDVQKLRTGFYYIAHKAQVPLVFVGFDFADKTVKINQVPFVTSGNIEQDLQAIARYFKTIGGSQKSWIKNYLEP